MQHFIQTLDMDSINNIESLTPINRDILNENNEKISLRVKQINDNLNELNKELNELILQCSHASSSIKMIAEDGGVAKLRKICDICKSQTGYLTQEESKEWSETK